MRLSKPSYGVFMVDIFASSVGIFILVSLLYIIESAKATSDEVMAEKFKTLVKRDKVPVEVYSLPPSIDPLHDWGIRARHAREKEEALILLLRDKILLYHTMQTLDKNEIIDSQAIAEYFEKYTKNRRLVLEIHYHDAYHSLKAKINESLPPDVRLWIHWAYNAGNIANPNPVFGKDNTGMVNMSTAQPQNPILDDSTDGMSSSVASADSRGNGSNPLGSAEGGNADGSAGQGSENGQSGTDSNGENGGENATDETTDAEGQTQQATEQALGDLPENTPQNPLQQEVERQMAANARAEQFIEQYLQSLPEQKMPQQSTPQQPVETERPPQDDNEAQPESEENKPQDENLPEQEQAQPPADNVENNPTSSSPNNRQKDPYEQLQRDNNEPQQPAASEDNAESQQSTQARAQMHIQKHVFVSVPLFSPIHHFQLDVQVPGFVHQQYSLNAVGLNLHLTPQKNANAIALDLNHGDAIVPQASSAPQGWIEVKVIKVDQPDQPLRGWFYGTLRRQVLMLPLYENKVRSISTGTEHYWFKQNNQSIEKFNTAPQESQTP